MAYQPQFMDPYATHLPQLAKAVALTTGPVLEIGCGMYSTMALHGFCQNRQLVSLESDRTWASRFMPFDTDTHKIYTGEYDEFDSLIRKTPWSVVLVDHAPAQRRKIEAEKVTHAELVIFHDTQEREQGLYFWEEIFKLYRWLYTDKSLVPWTTIATNSQSPVLQSLFSPVVRV